VPDCCYTDKFKIRLTLQARGVEKDSDELRIEISWDGKWADNKTNSDATLWSDEAQSSEYSHLCEDARRKMIAPCNKSCAKPPNRPETDGVNLGEGTGLLALGKALARFLGL
jgi:hypothetical protein